MNCARCIHSTLTTPFHIRKLLNAMKETLYEIYQKKKKETAATAATITNHNQNTNDNETKHFNYLMGVREKRRM